MSRRQYETQPTVVGLESALGICWKIILYVWQVLVLFICKNTGIVKKLAGLNNPNLTQIQFEGFNIKQYVLGNISRYISRYISELFASTGQWLIFIGLNMADEINIIEFGDSTIIPCYIRKKKKKN